MAKKVGVVLSGCGVYDGSEIYETVTTLLALARKGYEVQCLAPDVEQVHVVNHLEGKQMGDPARNVLVEAARLARGEIQPLAMAKIEEYDALFFPGGFGAAKNLSSFAFDGPEARVNGEVKRIIEECHAAGKPMAFVCIAPVVCAKVLGNGVELTIGTEEGVAKALEAMGARHVPKQTHEAHVDTKNKVVSSPAYMSARNILEVEKSINATVDALSRLMEE